MTPILRQLHWLPIWQRILFQCVDVQISAQHGPILPVNILLADLIA